MKSNAIRKLLKHELAIGLSHCHLSPKEYFRNKEKDRAAWLTDQQGKLHELFLSWAIRAGIVEEECIKDPATISLESRMGRYLVSAGLITLGAGGATAIWASGVALGTVTTAATVPAAGFLGYLSFTGLAGTTQVVTTTVAVSTAWTVAAIAAPIAVMGAAAYGYHRYQKNREFRMVVDKFEAEKTKIRKFYEQQIDSAASPVPMPVFQAVPRP